MRLTLISIWFQLLWFLAVIGRQETQWWLLLAVIATYLYVLLRQSIPLDRLFFVSFIGIAVDWLNVKFHLLEFPDDFLPTWLISLWFIFAWYAYNLVPVLKRFSSLAVVPVGGLLGAISYFAGYQLGAVTLPYPLGWSLTALFIEWTLIMWLIIKVVFSDRTRKKSH
ncbi:Protein of unknown function [Vibrio xiamenensis]|uniref:DUF2878 domain-containing protein n=1 Tax=Vibrio xiamenensis TaxID=861298 RepID=A0A1G7WNN4_9VIBR|nr:DUF2878 domain-containing protein [Vibrio xiamenensis]SDG73607.1 Protein of unknown function [Vibrio xiamenensis]